MSRSNTGAAARTARKTLQLCRQVGETIDGVLAASSDDVLRDLQVVNVLPAPDASRMLVNVRPVAIREGFNPIAALTRANDKSAEIRSEVAAAITRKHCPTLTFGLVLDDLTDPSKQHA
jgi:ribosome-binding factor A